MPDINIGTATEFSDPGRKIIGFDRFEVAVFKLDGEFFAYLNQCPHMGGPACQGKMLAKVEEVIADDKHQQGHGVLEDEDARGLPLARLRVRHPHRPAPGQSAARDCARWRCACPTAMCSSPCRTRARPRRPDALGALSVTRYVPSSPPSTGMTAPVRNEAAGRHRLNVMCATSSGSP